MTGVGMELWRGCHSWVVLFIAMSVLVAAYSQSGRSLYPSSGIGELDNGAVVRNWVKGLAIFEKNSTVWMRSVDGGGDWPKLGVNTRVVAAVVLSSIGACICAAGGIGGGGLFIPIFNLLLLFDAKTSAALSNIMILGGALAVLAWILLQTHPLSPGKPLIDYDVALFLNPNMLLGISVGVFCNIMFPGWLLISVFTVILFYMTSRSVKSGFSRWKKESARAKAKPAAASADAVENGNSCAF
jgi:hypothetical protein